MSSGVVHDRVTYIISPIVFIIGFMLYGWLCGVIVGLSVLFSGLMFSGDLDCHSNPYKRWGPIRVIWKPYRWMGSHRGIWSHGLILGTVIRVLWVGLIVYGLSFWYIDYRVVYEWLCMNRIYVLYCFIGLEIGSMSHTIMDIVSSGWKHAFG